MAAPCQEAWQGLPLMSWPTHGRDSHHETRVMRDDVMSYGDGDAVSGITLASFEDPEGRKVRFLVAFIIFVFNIAAGKVSGQMLEASMFGVSKCGLKSNRFSLLTFWMTALVSAEVLLHLFWQDMGHYLARYSRFGPTRDELTQTQTENHHLSMW